MMMLAGAFCIFSACTVVGVYAASFYRKAVEELEAFHRLIVHVGAQIDGFLSPLDVIFASYTEPCLEKNGFLPVLRRDGGAAALEAVRGRLYIGENAVNELESFFLGLGRHAASEESRHCAYYEKRIAELLRKHKEALPGKSRLCKAFGVLTGIMLAVFML